MTTETSVACPNCGLPSFARYGSSGWTQWQVCPHCGLAELDGYDGNFKGDKALEIFFQMCNTSEPEEVNQFVKKYFSGEPYEDAIFNYTAEEIQSILKKRKSLDYCKDDTPYIIGLAKRLEDDFQKSFLDANKSTPLGRDLKMSLSSQKDYLIKKAKTILNEARKKIEAIQTKRYYMCEAAVGDYVKLEDGTYRMIALTRNDQLQLYPEEGHYCCVFEDGNADASGTLAPPIPINSLELTNELKKGHVWSFLFEVGAEKGVNFDMEFKVWQL